MPEPLLSEMTTVQLHAEKTRCQQAGQAALTAGLLNECHVWEQRYYLVESYLMDPATIVLGATYGVANGTGLFIARRLNGVFAYGNIIGETEERGFPIGQLVTLDFARP